MRNKGTLSTFLSDDVTRVLLTLVPLPLQDLLSSIYRILAQAYPRDFPPSFFIQAARITLRPSATPSSSSSSKVALQDVLEQLCLAFDSADPAPNHADCIEVAYAALISKGKCLSCCQH